MVCFRLLEARDHRSGTGLTTVSDAGACIVAKGPSGLGL